MSELIILSVVCAVVIAIQAGVIFALLRSNETERANAREERQRLVLQLMSRNAAEYSLAQNKIDGEQRLPQSDAYREPVVGM